MYRKEQFQCLSFHAKKHLAIGKGGMILTDDHYAVEWFKKARYEGRSEKFYKKDQIDMLGWNMYMTPEQAARGLVLLQQLPLENPDIPEVGGGYRDLTEFNVFKKYRVIE
jgi:dTDP-4-amino-4,6-dideoxygalactose transaminase